MVILLSRTNRSFKAAYKYLNNFKYARVRRATWSEGYTLGLDNNKNITLYDKHDKQIRNYRINIDSLMATDWNLL